MRSRRRPARRRTPVVGTLPGLVAGLALTACAATPSGSGAEPPPVGAALDYQLGASYDPGPAVRVVVRDRTAAPAPGLYSVCYLNAFQTQPGELDTWPATAVLRRDGEPVRDPAWPDEALLDTSTAAGRAVVVDRVSGWIRGCADAGYRAVELDNLDAATRSDGALSRADTLAVARELVAVAHGLGLAAGQKNAAEDAAFWHERAGFDFAVAEECAAYAECGAYAEVYGPHVLAVEYTDALPVPFEEMCAAADAPASLVLRDRDLVGPDEPGHVVEHC